MSSIKKPSAPNYTTLPKKVRITEQTYLKMSEYLDWNPSLEGENDINFLIEESIKIALESDKEFKEWYLNLDNTKAVVITKKILVIEKIGNHATIKQGSKSLGKGLYELRDKQLGMRTYYVFHKDKIILLLNGGDKNTKKQQDSDIKKSRQLLEDIKRGTYEQSNIEQL